MGSKVSCHSNLGSDCTSFETGLTSTRARWGSSFEVNMSSSKSDDHTELWSANYKTRNQNKEQHICKLSLTASRDDDGVKSIKFTLYDHSAENKTDFLVEITRVARIGLRGEITAIKSSGGVSKFFTRDEENHSSVETRIVSYGGSNSLREGLFVLEMKKFFNCDDAYMVTLAHYYVTQERGLSVTAKIVSKGNCFDVEVEGPFKHPSTDLRKVLVKTCGTGVWSPNACSHCSGANESNTGTKTRFSNSSLNTNQSHHQESDEKCFRPIFKLYLPALPLFTLMKINNGENSGNHYNHGGNSINNSGTFNGNGNGGSVGGNFDASTWNYN